MATKTITVYTKLTRDMTTGLVRVKCEGGNVRITHKPQPSTSAAEVVAAFIKEALDGLK